MRLIAALLCSLCTCFAQAQNKTVINDEPMFSHWPIGLDSSVVSRYFEDIQGNQIPAQEFALALQTRFGLIWNCEHCVHALVTVCEQGGLGTWLVWYVCTNKQTYLQGETLQFTNRIQNWRFGNYPLTGTRAIRFPSGTDPHVVNVVIRDSLSHTLYNLELSRPPIDSSWNYSIPLFQSLYTDRNIPLAGLTPGQYKLVAQMRDTEFATRELDINFIVSHLTAVSPNVLATKYSIVSAYPNPFNPAVTITYSVAEQNQVMILIHNTLGQHVATLVNGKHQSGAYSTNWNASNFPSGVYLCTYLWPKGRLTTKLLLIK